MITLSDAKNNVDAIFTNFDILHDYFPFGCISSVKQDIPRKTGNLVTLTISKKVS